MFFQKLPGGSEGFEENVNGQNSYNFLGNICVKKIRRIRGQVVRQIAVQVLACVLNIEITCFMYLIIFVFC